MSENVKVSIIMPIYNVERYLEHSLQSVINQTLKEIEIICVNDGSTDSSPDIIEKFKNSDARIKVINKENSGYGDSMNIGIKSAIGEYIGIVEPDDYVENDMFESLYMVAQKNNAEIVKSDLYEFTTSGGQEKQTYIKSCCGLGLYNKVLSNRDKKIFFCRMNTWTGIYRKDFLINNKIFHNTTQGAAFQDNGFWFQTLALTNSIVFINKAFYHYKQDNPDSSINNKTNLYAMSTEFEFIKKNLKDRNIFSTFEDVYYAKCFHNYIYNYFRIAQNLRLEFLEKFRTDFENVNLNIIKKYLTPKQLKSLEEIILNPNAFNEKYKDKTLSYYNKQIRRNIIMRIVKFIIKYLKGN